MKRLVTKISAMILAIQGVYSQQLITRTNNEMRSNDLLCKEQVMYVDPGDRGVDCIWNLGHLSAHNKDVLQWIVAKEDTIAIMEQDRISHNIIRGDTLFDKGVQQRRSYCIYSEERPLIHYPFQYGDSIAGSYSGSGIDENTTLSVHGWGYTVADGMGLLTNGEDSLLHIVRIHMFDDCTESYGGQDSIHIKKDHFFWYCEGYRYPIMESVLCRASIGDTLSLALDSVSYMYLPIFQETLGEDPANELLRAEIALADSIILKKSGSEDPLASCKAALSPDGKHLNINYELSSSVDITFCACDILGNMIGYSHHDNQGNGCWQENIAISRKPIGNVLLLEVFFGDHILEFKVCI